MPAIALVSTRAKSAARWRYNTDAAGPRSRTPVAFSSEVGTGSREENASDKGEEMDADGALKRIFGGLRGQPSAGRRLFRCAASGRRYAPPPSARVRLAARALSIARRRRTFGSARQY